MLFHSPRSSASRRNLDSDMAAKNAFSFLSEAWGVSSLTSPAFKLLKSVIAVRIFTVAAMVPDIWPEPFAIRFGEVRIFRVVSRNWIKYSSRSDEIASYFRTECTRSSGLAPLLSLLTHALKFLLKRVLFQRSDASPVFGARTPFFNTVHQKNWNYFSLYCKYTKFQLHRRY